MTEASPRIDFETHPDRYRHWKLSFDGDVARLAPAPTARDVGQVMLRRGGDTPWWRVLRADGTPVPHLREQQLARLRAEATPMTPSGDGVDMRQARWSAARRAPDSGAQPSLFD